MQEIKYHWQCKKCKTWNKKPENEFKPFQFMALTFFTFGLYLFIYVIKSVTDMSQENFNQNSNQVYCKTCGTRR